MNSELSYLITFFSNEHLCLIKIALKLDKANLMRDCELYPREPENEVQLKNMLPARYKKYKMVDIEQINEVVIFEGVKEIKTKELSYARVG